MMNIPSLPRCFQIFFWKFHSRNLGKMKGIFPGSTSLSPAPPRLANELAFEWPTALFERLVQAQSGSTKTRDPFGLYGIEDQKIHKMCVFLEILPRENLVIFSVVIYRRLVHTKQFTTENEIAMCYMAIFTVELLMCFFYADETYDVYMMFIFPSSSRDFAAPLSNAWALKNGGSYSWEKMILKLGKVKQLTWQRLHEFFH